MYATKLSSRGFIFVFAFDLITNSFFFSESSIVFDHRTLNSSLMMSTVTLNKFSGDTYLRQYLPNHQAGREEREQESAMIRKKANIDPLRSGGIRNDSHEG